MATINFTVAGAVNKVPVLESNDKLSFDHIPYGEWVDVLADYNMNTDYKNTTNKTQIFHLRTLAIASTSLYLRAATRKTGTQTYFYFDGTQIPFAGDKRYETQVIIPPGWEWYYNISGGSKAMIDRIYRYT